MRTRRRVIAAFVLAVLCAPGTWLRSETGSAPLGSVPVQRIAGESETDFAGWTVSGVWQLRGEGLLFGGFSALIVLPEGNMMSFSDRGMRLTFAEPGTDAIPLELVRQPLARKQADGIEDIEAATRDPTTGTYWLAFEHDHAIHRYAKDHSPTGARELDAGPLGWSDNSGAEALTRLADGRFLVLPEGKRTGLLFEGDPVDAAEYETFGYSPPVPGHGATDMAQLPDGRVLLLLRNLDIAGGIPPFESKIAIAPVPDGESTEPWAPKITLDLAGVVPRENYEGIAVREEPDGRIAVWLIADDNLSVFQRTLLVKLDLDPAALQQ